MNYAKSNPDLVILAVNTFVKVGFNIQSLLQKRWNEGVLLYSGNVSLKTHTRLLWATV
jgi:hypothetical protein